MVSYTIFHITLCDKKKEEKSLFSDNLSFHCSFEIKVNDEKKVSLKATILPQKTNALKNIESLLVS